MKGTVVFNPHNTSLKLIPSFSAPQRRQMGTRGLLASKPAESKVMRAVLADLGKCPTQPTKQRGLLEKSYRGGPALPGSLGLPAVHTSLVSPTSPTQLTLSLTGSSGKPLSCRPWVAAAGSCQGSQCSEKPRSGGCPPQAPNRASRVAVGASSPRLPWQREEREPGAEPGLSRAHLEPLGYMDETTGYWTGPSDVASCQLWGMGLMGWHPGGSPGPHRAQCPVLPVTPHPRLLLPARV